MTPKKRQLPAALHNSIEQAIARGATTEQIMARLGCTYDDVQTVLDNMEQVVNSWPS